MYEDMLYMDDSYLKEFDAAVISIKDNKFIILDKTTFYPNGGGQPFDTGKMINGSKEYEVIFVGKFDGKISHEIKGNEDNSLKEGNKVHCIINWERRYKLMRMHTAAHLLSGILNKELGVKITGNQLDLDKSRIDFDLEECNKDVFQRYVDRANEMIEEDRSKKNMPIITSYIQRKDAEKDPTLFRLANALPPTVEVLRIIEIKGFDKQADGGTHVRSLGEIGRISLLEIKNKGKNNRRLYFKIE